MQPVLIYTIARSRSSHVAQIVHEELGTFVGTTSGPSPKYPVGGMENLPLKRLLKQKTGEAWDPNKRPRFYPGLRDDVLQALEADGWEPGTRWQHKTAAARAPLLMVAFPEQLAIAVRRPREEIVASMREKNGPVARREVLDAHEAQLDYIETLDASLVVDTSREGWEKQLRYDLRTVDRVWRFG